MSSPFASELTELAAPRPGFRLSAPHALAARGAAAHARGPGSARRSGGAEVPELLSRLQSGKKEGCPLAEAHGRALFLHSPRPDLSLHGVSSAIPDPGLPGEE